MNDPLKFTLAVTVGRIYMHVDRTVSVTVRSEKELSNIEFAVVHEAFQKPGWFLFSETNVDEAAIPKEDIDRNVKSQAQRIRGKCYHLYKLKEEAGEDCDPELLYRRFTNWAIAKLDTEIAKYDG